VITNVPEVEGLRALWPISSLQEGRGLLATTSHSYSWHLSCYGSALYEFTMGNRLVNRPRSMT
jgi:hypothetical protein